MSKCDTQNINFRCRDSLSLNVSGLSYVNRPLLTSKLKPDTLKNNYKFMRIPTA